MERSDFINSRVDVVKNIYTLYRYAKSSVAEEREWALKRYKQGQWFVVEKFGDTLMFAPSRFSGYQNNTKQKHTENHGDGTQTNSNFLKLKLYVNARDDSLSKQFRIFMNGVGIENNKAKFLIPTTFNVAKLRTKNKCYFIAPTQNKDYDIDAWRYFLNHNTIRIKEGTYDQIDSTKQRYETIIKITEGDIICCKNESHGLWGIGIVLSQSKQDTYHSDSHFARITDDDTQTDYHHFDVAWLCFNDEGYIPVSDLNIQSPEQQWESNREIIQSTKIPKYISDFLLKNGNVNYDKIMEANEVNKEYERYIRLLEANKNLILTGAPGTGKTYLAREIAKAMDAEYDFVQFHPSYDYTDFVEGLRPIKSEDDKSIGFERKNGVFKKFCIKALGNIALTVTDLNASTALKFFKDDLKKTGSIMIPRYKNLSFIMVKVSLSVTDKISVLTDSESTLPNEAIIEYMQSGRSENEYTKLIGQYIKEHYLHKRVPINNSTASKKYVFIIDEINRGEISKIFGELFFSIDPGYRGDKVLPVKTQYQNLITDKTDPFYNGFYVPDNVYIIGTMNDIDRSVESMDFAMRRRFAWEEVKANDNTGMLDSLNELKEETVEVMRRLNAAIWDEATDSGIEGLSTAYHIGGAYFSKLTLYLNVDHSNKEEAYANLWNNHLKGLLFEYLRGTPDATAKLKSLEDRYYNRTDDDTER